MSGIDLLDTGHEEYIRDQLANDDSVWRICSWHKNQELMNVHGKGDAVGWGVYEECRLGGAIIATAHDHSYARTHLMDEFGSQSIVSTSNTLQIQKGQSFVFVSGLGGHSYHSVDDRFATKPWWAAVYNPEMDKTLGAMFCNFNEGGVQNRAHCYFKDINGVVADEFDLIASDPSEN